MQNRVNVDFEKGLMLLLDKSEGLELRRSSNIKGLISIFSANKNCESAVFDIQTSTLCTFGKEFNTLISECTNQQSQIYQEFRNKYGYLWDK